MYISGINGYLSKFEGTEVDAAVERVQGLDVELALKVDKTTTINDIPLTNNIVLTAEDIGAIPAGAGYGKSLKWEDSILSLLDQEGRVLSNTYIEVDLGRWGHIFGDLNDQEDLKIALDSKQPMITPEAMLSSDLVDDTGHVHKFATAEQLAQIETNKNNIATNAANIDINAANIATNTAEIAINKNNIATNTADIATNRNNIATNTANIATNTADIATNRSNIATNTQGISTINSKIPEQASSSNQLADKDFVNSSIATSTATFIGTFNSLEDLEAYSGPKDDNDYAFVITTDSAGNTLYNRYKYTGSAWLFEYALNNSSFTAVQWAAIQSGITSTDVAQITTNKNNISAINATLSGFGNIVTHNVDEFATAAQGAKADTALQSIDSAMVVAALGYTPYNSTNPAGYISGITSSDVTTALGYTPYDATNPEGYISGITSSDVTNALGYTPYDASNPEGYISGITSSDVTTALGFTPYDASNPEGYISGITSSDVITALGFTPYDATNPEGYISGIDSTDVVNALGFTPYNATNPEGYISSASISSLTDVTLTNVTNNQALLYNATTQKWENKDIVTSTAWGDITGTLADQTDLQQALDGKQPTITGAATTITNNNLTAGRVLVSDNSGKVAAGSITTAKLGYLSDVTSNIQVQINGKYDASNPAGYISGITSEDVTTALGFTPYDASNPEGYTSNIGTVTSVNNVSPVDGNVTLEIPDTATWGNISGTLSNQTDLQAALNSKYDASNPAGYISSASVDTLTDVVLTNLADGEVLKYNATSQKWENSASGGGGSSTLEDLIDVKITSPTQGQNLTYDAINNKWINTTTTATVGWGGITGNINDQTDLKNALDSKASVTIRDWSAS